MKRLLILLPLAYCLLPVPAKAQCSNTSIGNGFTCVQTAHGTAHALSVSVTISATGTGHLLAVWTFASSATISTPTDSAGDAATTVLGPAACPYAGTQCALHVFVTGSTASTSVICKDTATAYLGCSVVELSGNSASPLDKNPAVNTPNTASWASTATGTTSQATELLLGLAQSNTTDTLAVSGSWVAIENNWSYGSGVITVLTGYQTVGAIGSYQFTGTSSAAQTIGVGVASFHGAGWVQAARHRSVAN